MSAELARTAGLSRTSRPVRWIGWSNIHHERAYRLPIRLLPECGSRTLTFGYVLSYRNGLARGRLGVAANALGLTRRTVRQHLKWLIKKSLVAESWNGRSSCFVSTIAREDLGRCLYLPWFALLPWPAIGPLPWSVQVVFAAVVTRWCSIVWHAESNDEAYDGDPFEYMESIDGPRHFRFSTRGLAALTGLARRSVITARQILVDLEVVLPSWDFDARHRAWTVLFPNEKWRFPVLPD